MPMGSCRIVVNLEFKHLSGGKWPAPRCEWDVRQSAVITVRLWHAWGKLKAVCSWNKPMLAWHDGPWREETDTLCHNHWLRIVLNVSGSLNGSFSLDSENVPEDKLHEFSTSQRYCSDHPVPQDNVHRVFQTRSFIDWDCTADPDRKYELWEE